MVCSFCERSRQRSSINRSLSATDICRKSTVALMAEIYVANGFQQARISKLRFRWPGGGGVEKNSGSAQLGFASFEAQNSRAETNEGDGNPKEEADNGIMNHP